MPKRSPTRWLSVGPLLAGALILGGCDDPALTAPAAEAPALPRSAIATTNAVQEAKLLPGAGDGGFFGFDVAMSGNVAIVGAMGDDDNGTSSGSAYVFRRSGSAWMQEAKLLASDGEADDSFGWSVAISGNVAVIGAPLAEPGGSAYVFRWSGSAWIEEAKLLPDPGVNSFGWSVGVDGDVAVVGDLTDNDNAQNSGAAYVFRRGGSGWAREAKLLASDGAAQDWFGEAVAISGDVVVAGASLHQDNGSAYVFRWSGSAWVQEAKLLASDDGPSDRFGASVAIGGNVAVVGALGAVVDEGYAYVFRWSGSAWVQEARLLPADGAADDWFGGSVAIRGDVAVVGAYQDDDNGESSGSAYVFRRAGSEWVQDAKLLPADGDSDDEFGISVATTGDLVVVGAWSDEDDFEAFGSGSAYVFELIRPGCFVEAGSLSDRLTTTTGETFWGEAANEPGFMDADWAHTAPGFVMESFDRGLAVNCFANGGVSAFIDGEAVVNGNLGYLYSVTVRDRGDDEIIVEAPGGDATTSFPVPTTVVIPATLPVTSGSAGPGLVWIQFDDMKCFYRANTAGDAYEFSSCEDPSLGPGDTVEITTVRLFVAGPGRETTVVSANLSGGSGTSPGASDTYTINVWVEATGELVYSFSGTLVEGDDIVITLR